MPTPKTNLARQLARLGWSIKEAARRTGVKYETMRNYSKGKTRAPREVMRVIAHYRLKNWRNRINN